MRLQGESVNQIAENLRKEKIPIPSIYAVRKGLRKAAIRSTLGEYQWSCEKVRVILTNQSYVGDVINFRTYTKSFKLQKRLKNTEENWKIYKNVHDPIIERSVWETVSEQKKEEIQYIKYFGRIQKRKGCLLTFK